MGTGSVSSDSRSSSGKQGVGSTRPIPKNTILTEAGRSCWYRKDGSPLNAYCIGFAGGSASGKTRVAQEVLKKLGVPWVLVVSQDNFYKSLTPEQSKAAFRNEHDFDSPDSLDYDVFRKCLEDLKYSRSVQIPNYSFTLHQRVEETTYLYGAAVVIVEGLFVLHDKRFRDLLDLKVFVQCDSDLMLARRLRRDLVERGRDATGILDQYLRFVKPSFDNFVYPTSRFADVIVPGFDNETGINLLASHIRQQLDERKVELRGDLFRTSRVDACTKEDVAGEEETISCKDSKGKPSIAKGRPAIKLDKSETVDEGKGDAVPDTVHLMPQTNQLRGIITELRDRMTSSVDFIFLANRLSTLVIEHALSLLPYRTLPIITRTQIPYIGRELDVAPGHLCGVSILRSGASLEKGLRRVLRDCPIGNVLIQSDAATGEPLLYHVSLPACLIVSVESADKSWVLLLDSQIGTGAAALMAVRVLLDHGVREEHVLFCCILVSRSGGIWALKNAFPKVRVICSAVDDALEERWEWHDEFSPKALEENDHHADRTSVKERKPKKVFAILPGLGSFGDRYYGT